MRTRVVTHSDRYRQAVVRLLVDADDAFVPPLTGAARDHLVRSGAEAGRADIDEYADRCLRRPMIGAFDGDTLIGFASIQQIDHSASLDGYTPTNHVSILIVDREHRNRGVATAIYRRLSSDLPTRLRRPYVSTKTWNTNHAHLAVLEKLGFDCVDRIPDDRGENVDTVYYARPTRYRQR